MRWRCSPKRAIRRRAAQLALAAALLGLGLPVLGAASAVADSPAPGSLDLSVHYLQSAQNADGGFGGHPGGASDPSISAWAALGLAAAGVNPHDQAAAGGADVYTYLSGQAAKEVSQPGSECLPGGCTTAFERMLLVVDAAGGSAADFGGVDLPQQILARELPDHSFAHVDGGRPAINDTVFAILSLSALHEAAAEAAVQQAATWLESQQNEDGSWPSICPRSSSGCEAEDSLDLTGAALEALNAAGRHHTAAQTGAIKLLHEAQRSDGGFAQQPSEVASNAASTAWVVQGLWAAGEEPATWTAQGASPLAYLTSLQGPEGGIANTAGGTSEVWMTAYVLAALSGRPFPIAEVPRSSTPATQAGASSSSAATSGGESSNTSAGVGAGGGGAGARLFSAPKPQSRGQTRGGLRVATGAATHASTPDTSHGGAATSGSTATPASKTTGAVQSNPKPAVTTAASSPAAASGDGAGIGPPEVRGVLVGGPGSGLDETAAAAPGLQSAGAGSGHAWLAIAIAAAIGVLAVLGSQFERRRPQAVL